MAEAESDVKMAEVESDEVDRLQNKPSEMLRSPSSIVLPASKKPRSSYFLTKNVPEMVNEGPGMKLLNQSCVIREDIVNLRGGEQLTVYSSSARLPTFSIGLASTKGAPFRGSNVDPKDKSPPCYFQMPELGARVFLGDVDGVDTIACCLLDRPSDAFEMDLDFEHAALKSLYKDVHPGGLSDWLRARPEKYWKIKRHFGVILSGTELFHYTTHWGKAEVGNLRGKSPRMSSSSSDYKDRTGDETIRQPLDVVEQSEDPIPGVYGMGRYWRTVGGPHLYRVLNGSYLGKPKFVKMDELLSDFRPENDILHLTRFDDFVILGNRNLELYLEHGEATDIVRTNSSEPADVIATQLVKSTAIRWGMPPRQCPITAIVILLDHKEILLREQKKENVDMKDLCLSSELLGPKPNSLLSMWRDVKIAAKLKEKKKFSTLKEEDEVFESRIGDEKIIMMEEDHKVKILVDEALPNIPQISIVSVEENELGMKSKATSSNLTSAEVIDDSEGLSSIVLFKDDDYKSTDFIASHHITKWIICRDLLETTLLCFFNIEEMQYEFYFEDHESMATIIGLGVPHSKVILECGSPHVSVVEILEEDWVVVWAHSNDISLSFPEDNVMKQEIFPHILHCIANIINKDNIVCKANDGVGGANGKGNAKGNDDNKDMGKGKAHDHENHGNISHSNGGSNEASDENDEKKKKEKDENNDKKDGCDQDDGKIFNDCKEVKAVVHLRLLPGGVLEEKKKKKELGEVHEGEGKKKEGCKRIVKKKKKNLTALLQTLTIGKNGNAISNQSTTQGIEDVDVDENLLNQLEKQIHSHMVFTFTIKDEAGGPLKTIQATIDPITFQFSSNNKENYPQKKRFGWFHEKLQVAFGVVNAQNADLVENSCKVLESSEAKVTKLQGYSNENARKSSNDYRGEVGFQYGVKVRGVYGRTNGLEAKTTKGIHDSWETNKTLTKGGFCISEYTDLNSHQLKYLYFPRFPFNEEEFQAKDEVERLKMYENPICQLQRVSCEGTWQPYDSENLEAYKLKVSRDVEMTRIFNVDLETGEETMPKGVWKEGKNLPLCFIQKLEKEVYLNHAMSHLASSTAGVYRLKEQQVLNDRLTTFVTQAQNRKEPNWPSDDRLVDVKQ